MIVINQLTKTFDEQTIFEDLSLTIETGEFVVFSGPSGCGKTTLLNMIGGLEVADHGEIIVNGNNILKQKNLMPYFREQVGFLFQNFALIDNKTVKENLAIIKKKSRNSQISLEEALQFVGLASKMNSKVYKLSGGEQQRVALARLMLKKNQIILADEPTGSLDKKNAEEVMTILEAMHHSGKTVIVVTHDEEIKKRAKRVIQL
ncbi:bacteriocin ABC transporter ATP-binding protein [Enterococcus alcedinis]|uniref:Bacteriocin ABC transporter ATP-binding protein n=2 Tax=Enterococcus TaxID=1350 RepID=A0A917N3T9_9ENTE|nr:heme ABC exporter ATP-binding protein CcmA [Enterococcus alcedinis]MBP2101546.1 putative ABC transport system ATP-binding protein [Enterococcus alcedinis]GGI65060.1 bacteriocin ABC transporter ATP-binding protein [Enterococcus alcedinis]